MANAEKPRRALSKDMDLCGIALHSLKQSVDRLRGLLSLPDPRLSVQVKLSRFDLFHGHMFRHSSWPHGLGILFHAMEYPCYGESFDIDLGFCQVNSPIGFDQRAWHQRNWIYYQVESL